MLKKLKYIAVAVTNLEEGAKLYENLLGLKPMTPAEDTQWGFRRIMLGDGQEPFVEVMQPKDDTVPLARFMKEHSGPSNPDGQGIYLVCFETDNLPEEIARIKANGGRVTADSEPPSVAWIHPLTMRNVFIELQQAKQ